MADFPEGVSVPTWDGWEQTANTCLAAPKLLAVLRV